ncbi:cysteine synthase family protein [Saliterribacillus persicus]|uniref:Cysteine synthase n=1 Tax=Saliterribacillus persicus TaxID=930114 RepID=A0A368Y9Y7_9BACI|nr:cysteine synthase family protein [Saliterribacillus persicus]RCW77022.1 cystathionine beta-synthase/cysteine synthase A [Saliterribacillus persicus]
MIHNILETIGETPLITIPNSNTADEGRILLKYERFNPGGSIKDRPALYIIQEAERKGLLKPGGTIIESSSGNFGISLAMIGAARGYRVIILADPKTTSANISVLKAFGAEVIIVTEKDDSGSYHKTRITQANKLAQEIPNAYRPDQCFNLLNRETHYKNTAQEIMHACSDKIAVFITAVSTGGQLGGISKYLKTFAPHVHIIGVDAEGSTIFGGEAKSYKIPGVGLSWTPLNLDVNYVDRIFKVKDEHAFIAARSIARHEGILIGPSSGACVMVALKVAQELGPDKQVVCMVADGGDRYLSTLFNDEWMKKQHFSLSVNTEMVRATASKLIPWSENPQGCANYRTDLIKSLNVPKSTLKMNQETVNRSLLNRERSEIID